MADLQRSARACGDAARGFFVPFLGIALRTGTKSHAGAALVEDGQQVDSYSYLDNDGNTNVALALVTSLRRHDVHDLSDFAHHHEQLDDSLRLHR
eukprot:753270-Hanusia_phi.AAC.7